MKRAQVIAVDFDGCLCEDRWPKIGKPIQANIDDLLRRKAEGAKIILWTCRVGKELDAAVSWCAERGIVFDAVNDTLPELKEIYGGDTRKVYADEYWDDRAVPRG